MKSNMEFKSFLIIMSSLINKFLDGGIEAPPNYAQEDETTVF